MKLIINNLLSIEAEYHKEGTLVIQSFTTDELKFFNNWCELRKKSYSKKDHVKDIKYTTLLESGSFIGCQPIISLNEDLIHIVYDYKDVN